MLEQPARHNVRHVAAVQHTRGCRVRWLRCFNSSASAANILRHLSASAAEKGAASHRRANGGNLRCARRHADAEDDGGRIHHAELYRRCTRTRSVSQHAVVIHSSSSGGSLCGRAPLAARRNYLPLSILLCLTHASLFFSGRTCHCFARFFCSLQVCDFITDFTTYPYCMFGD